jgi:hypothetical protein
MANEMIKFLRGNVASLPANATPGAVYFTKDEGLYLGLEDGTYHRYGDFITVNDVASLPADGAHESCMYYCVAENVLAKWNGTGWTQINKQKTLAELGGVAKSVYEAKIAALEKADTDNATATANLATYVGTFNHDSAKTVIEYINAKTDGIATSGNLEALGGRVTAAEGEIDVLQAAIAEGGSVTVAIAEAKAAGDAAQADVDALEEKVGTVAEGKTVIGLIGDAQTQADKGVEDAANAKARADEAYNLADGKATMDQVNEAIAGAGHAVKADVDAVIEQLGKDYVAADTALETKLQGNIDKKVDQTAYDTKMTELGNEDVRLAGLISDMDTAYKAADTALDGRIANLEGTITGLSGAMHFKGVENELPEDVTGYADGDVIVVGDKEYVFNGGAFVEFGDVSAEGERIAVLEGIVGKEADGENAATGLVKAMADNTTAIAAEKTRAEAKEAELVQADIDNLAEAKKYTDDEIAELNVAQYAKQADLDAHTGDTVSHITADERVAWNAAEKNAKDYADGLNTAMNTRVEALEAIDHDHANKAELDKITDGDVAKWNAAQANAEATAAGALAGAKTELEGKIADGDATTLGSAKAYTDELANGQVKTNTEAIATKANAADVYAKTETYNKDEIEALLTWGSF